MLESEQASYVAKKQMVTKMGYPMLGIGVDYVLIDARPGNTSMMNGKDMIMPMVNISLPIYRKKYRSMVKEAELGRTSAMQAVQNTRNDLYVQYKETFAYYKDAERRIDLYAGQADLAKRTLDLLITGLATGSKSYDEVLRMQQQLLDYRFKLVEAVVDQNLAVAGFESLMGRND
jgi:outer membrane protein TolC